MHPDVTSLSRKHQRRGDPDHNGHANIRVLVALPTRPPTAAAVAIRRDGLLSFSRLRHLLRPRCRRRVGGALPSASGTRSRPSSLHRRPRHRQCHNHRHRRPRRRRHETPAGGARHGQTADGGTGLTEGALIGIIGGACALIVLVIVVVAAKFCL